MNEWGSPSSADFPSRERLNGMLSILDMHYPAYAVTMRQLLTQQTREKAARSETLLTVLAGLQTSVVTQEARRLLEHVLCMHRRPVKVPESDAIRILEDTLANVWRFKKQASVPAEPDEDHKQTLIPLLRRYLPCSGYQLVQGTDDGFLIEFEIPSTE